MGGLDYRMGCLSHGDKAKVTKHPWDKYQGITVACTSSSLHSRVIYSFIQE